MVTRTRRNFKKDWGISCKDLAHIEGVTCEAIRMRVLNYGTPFQRRNKPTKFEKKYGKTLYVLANEMNLHPQTVARREHLYGDVYYAPQWTSSLGGRIMNDRGEHWSDNPKMFNIKEASTHMTVTEIKSKLGDLTPAQLESFVAQLEEYEKENKKT